MIFKYHGKKSLFLGLAALPFISCQALANVPNAEKKTDLNYQSDALTPLKTENAAPDLFGETTGSLPFFGKEIRARGYELPDPYGIGVSYMDIHQNINVKSINFSDLKLQLFPGMPALPIGDNLLNIKVGNTREKSKTTTARLDAWLFPFMNVYGVVGHTKGRSDSKIDVEAKLLPGMPIGFKDLNFTLKFKGTTWGGGTTIAYGYHDWFGTMDFNYTTTTFDVLDGHINAFTYTPRVGYRFTVPGVEKFSIPVSHASIWLGTMYQNVDQDFRGSIRDLQMPAELVRMVDLVNKDGQGRFRVKQHLKSPWNMLVGGQYEITRNFNVTTEVGFARRNSVLVAGEFRF